MLLNFVGHAFASHQDAARGVAAYAAPGQNAPRVTANMARNLHVLRYRNEHNESNENISFF